MFVLEALPRSLSRSVGTIGDRVKRKVLLCDWGGCIAGQVVGLSIESMVWMPSVAKVAVGAVAGSVFLAREERHHSLALLEWLRDDSVDLG